MDNFTLKDLENIIEKRKNISKMSLTQPYYLTPQLKKL